MNVSRKLAPCRLVSAVLILLLIGGSAALGGAIFINLPLLLLTFGLTFLLLLGTFGRDYLKFLPDSILSLFTTPSAPMPRYADIARHGSRYAMTAGGILTLICYVNMLAGLSDPSSIGYGIATSILPMLYALILSEVIFATLYKIYADGGAPKATPPLASKTLAITMIFLGVLTATLIAILISLSHTP